jgi:hypothetical protein
MSATFHMPESCLPRTTASLIGRICQAVELLLLMLNAVSDVSV